MEPAWGKRLPPDKPNSLWLLLGSVDTNHNQCHNLQPRCRHERVPRHENARSTAHSRPTAQSRWPAWLPRLLR